MSTKMEYVMNYFVFFIIFIKIVFVLSAIGHIIMSHSVSSTAQNIDPKLVYWKERTEFIFIVSMSILLVYHFYPRHNKSVDSETSLLFFLFGIILLFTANWSIFIKEAPWYATISNTLK